MGIPSFSLFFLSLPSPFFCYLYTDPSRDVAVPAAPASPTVASSGGSRKSQINPFVIPHRSFQPVRISTTRFYATSAPFENSLPRYHPLPSFSPPSLYLSLSLHPTSLFNPYSLLFHLSLLFLHLFSLFPRISGIPRTKREGEVSRFVYFFRMAVNSDFLPLHSRPPSLRYLATSSIRSAASLLLSPWTRPETIFATTSLPSELDIVRSLYPSGGKGETRLFRGMHASVDGVL